MSETINWGIIGPGRIAHKFAHDLLLAEGANLHAVASRNEERAKAFAKEYKASRSYTSYEELADDPEVDVVYIATPHVFHFENTMMCLKAGKHVLCEKPLGMNEKEVQTMVDEARQRQLFLMEGMWTRFIPATEKVLEIIQNGKIGQVDFLRAEFGYQADKDPASRINDIKLGGGSLMDIGIYPIYLSLLAMGEPENTDARARFTPTGVDSFCEMTFTYADGRRAILESNIEEDTPTEAFIAGSQGSVKMHGPFYSCGKLSLQEGKDPIKTFEVPYVGNGFYHEIMEVMDCLRSGKTESPKLPHAISLQMIRIMDEVGAKIGLEYDSAV